LVAAMVTARINAVLRYVADFDKREVTYHGWNGQNYAESYPDAAIEQS